MYHVHRRINFGYLSVMLGLGLGLRPWGCGLHHILVIVKLLRTVAHVMTVK